MANWLEKFAAPRSVKAQTSQVPVLRQQGQVAPSNNPRQELDTLPNASVIYGIAASVLSVLAVFLMFSGRWFTGFLVLLPAVCFLGFAIQFLRAK